MHQPGIWLPCLLLVWNEPASASEPAFPRSAVRTGWAKSFQRITQATQRLRRFEGFPITIWVERYKPEQPIHNGMAIPNKSCSIL
jgi:hypothetical protein